MSAQECIIPIITQALRLPHQHIVLHISLDLHECTITQFPREVIKNVFTIILSSFFIRSPRAKLFITYLNKHTFTGSSSAYSSPHHQSRYRPNYTSGSISGPSSLQHPTMVSILLVWKKLIYNTINY